MEKINFKHSLIFFNFCILISPFYFIVNYEPIIFCLILILILGISHGALDNLKGKITLIAIAHRLSTIKNVDCIYVLKNGRLIESGSYSDLIKDKESNFGKMIELQSLADS